MHDDHDVDINKTEDSLFFCKISDDKWYSFVFMLYFTVLLVTRIFTVDYEIHKGGIPYGG